MRQTKHQDQYRIGRLVLIDGIPHNIHAVTRDSKSRVAKVHLRSWAGHPIQLSGSSFRRKAEVAL